jgi:GNAT superfamily N-acetyltransferase
MKDDPTIDIAKSEDAAALYSLVKRTADKMVCKDFTPGGAEEFFKAVRMLVHDRPEGHILLTARRNGVLVGMIDVRDNYHICLFFVDMNEQHKGIGRQLFDEIRRRCRASDTPPIFEVNSSLFAVPIYEKLGFKKPPAFD